MRVEDLQDQLHGDGTLRSGYVVVWNGTRDSASGTPYLDSSEVPAVADAAHSSDRPTPAGGRRARPPWRAVEPMPRFKSALRCAVVELLTTHGPMTTRALTEHLHGSHDAVKQCVYNMVKGGYLVDMGRAVATDKKFGRGQPPKLFGVAA